MGKFLGKANVPAEEVLNWRTGRNSVREELVEIAEAELRNALNEEGIETWWGEVRYDHEYGVFEVTLWEGEP